MRTATSTPTWEGSSASVLLARKCIFKLTLQVQVPTPETDPIESLRKWPFQHRDSNAAGLQPRQRGLEGLESG